MELKSSFQQLIDVDTYVEWLTFWKTQKKQYKF